MGWTAALLQRKVDGAPVKRGYKANKRTLWGRGGGLDEPLQRLAGGAQARPLRLVSGQRKGRPSSGTADEGHAFWGRNDAVGGGRPAHCHVTGAFRGGSQTACVVSHRALPLLM